MLLKAIACYLVVSRALPSPVTHLLFNLTMPGPGANSPRAGLLSPQWGGVSSLEAFLMLWCGF